MDYVCMFISTDCGTVALLQVSPATSQALVNGAEAYAKILSKTLTNDTTEVVKAKRNIGN